MIALVLLLLVLGVVLWLFVGSEGRLTWDEAELLAIIAAVWIIAKWGNGSMRL